MIEFFILFTFYIFVAFRFMIILDISIKEMFKIKRNNKKKKYVMGDKNHSLIHLDCISYLLFAVIIGGINFIFDYNNLYSIIVFCVFLVASEKIIEHLIEENE